MKRVLLLVLSFVLIPMTAFSQGDSRDGTSAGITHGVSVSYMSLPFEFDYHHYYPSYEYVKVMDAKGYGVNYDLMVPLFQSRVQLKTGLGFSHFLYRDDHEELMSITTMIVISREEYDRIKTLVPADNFMEVDNCIEKQRAVEYMYLSVPVNIGYRVVDRKGFTVVPFLGITMKYNLSFIEKFSSDSYSYGDLYMDVFDGNFKENDASRFMLQYDLGLELGYRHVYATVSYMKDLSRLYEKVTFVPNYYRLTGYYGPKVMHNWQVGFGFRF